MKNVSDEYKQIAETLDGSARYYHQILVDGVELTDTIVEFKYSHTCNNSTNFSVGNTASAMVEFKIDEPSINLENKEIQVNQGLKLADGSMEYVKLGKFKVLSPEIERFQANYQCVDAMTYKMATVYESALTYPTTDIAILEEICQQAGIELANTDLVAHTIDKKLDNYTKREMIGFIAQLQGKNAIINTDGKLELIWYTQTDYVVDDNRIYSDRTDIIKNENDYVLGYIKSTYGSKEIVSGDINTQGIKITNPYMTQEILDEVFDKIKGLTFRAINIDFYGDFRLEVGDIVAINTNNESYVVPIMSLEQSSDGGVVTTIGSIGETATQNSVDTNGSILNEIKRSVVNSETARSIAEQAADKISFVVEGDSTSEFTVTENVIKATTEKLVIKTEKGGEVVIKDGVMYVDDIFAEEITATGTITGAKLIGATGEFEGDISSYNTITLYTGYIQHNPDGTTEYVKDAGKVILDASSDYNVAGAAPERVYLTIDSHSDNNHTAIIKLTQKNKVILKEEDDNGNDGTIIQFGNAQVGDNVNLTVKPNFTYKDSPGDVYTSENISSPHIDRLMTDKLAVENAYLEKITTVNPLTVNAGNFYALELKRLDSKYNVGIKFENQNGVLGYLAISSVDGKLQRILGSNGNTAYDIIDSSGGTLKGTLYYGTDKNYYINASGLATLSAIRLDNGGSILIKDSNGDLRTLASLGTSNNFSFATAGVENTVIIGGAGKTTSMKIYGNNIQIGDSTNTTNITLNSNTTAMKSSASISYLGVKNTKREGRLLASADGYIGIWDVTKNRWLCYSDADGHFVVPNSHELKAYGGFTAFGGTMTSTLNTQNVVPTTNSTSTSTGYTIGTSNYRYRYLYAFGSSIQTSDRNYKHSFDYEDVQRLDSFFNALKPCSYYMVGGDRKHLGFVAQDVEEAMIQNGMTIDDLSFVCKDAEYTLKDEKQPDTEENRKYTLDEDGNQKYIYGLKYTELHALEVDQIQKLKTRVSDLEFALSQALARIEMLEEKISK